MANETYLTEDEREECRRERIRMARDLAEGRLVISDEEISEERWAGLVQMLEAAGFRQNEGHWTENVSHSSRSGAEIVRRWGNANDMESSATRPAQDDAATFPVSRTSWWRALPQSRMAWLALGACGVLGFSALGLYAVKESRVFEARAPAQELEKYIQQMRAVRTEAERAQAKVSGTEQPPPVPRPQALADRARTQPGGLTHDQIAITQYLLRMRGYDVESDGTLGPKTKAAVGQLQTGAGLAVTGYPTQQLLDALVQPP
jgi:hypothetical protein